MLDVPPRRRQPAACEGVMVRLTSSLGRGYFASVHDLREIRAYEATLAKRAAAS